MLNRSLLLSLVWITSIVFLASCKSPPPAATSPDPVPLVTAATPTMELLATETAISGKPNPGDRAIRAKDTMEMIFVPGAEFQMGSDEIEVNLALEQCRVYGANCAQRYFSVEMPVHTVKLDSFWIDKTEVTSGQYQQCVLEGACEPPGCSSDGESYPVVCVSWYQAAAYCQWAGAELPSEAEWEYVARGPKRNRYPWGNEFDGTLLNYCDSNCTLGKRDAVFDDGYAESAPVGSFPAGASWVGALDMAGNVWEMVADWNGNYPQESLVNPSGPDTGTRKIVRGGSWHASPDHVRSALRTHASPTDSIDHAGFRCALSSPPE